MNRIGQILHNFFYSTYPEYPASFVAVCVGVAVLLAWSRGRRRTWRYGAYAAAVVLLVRLALFGQYFSWRYYVDHLTVDDVGWRQASVLSYEHRKYFKNTEKLRYFAVGSSQTLALYTPYSEKHKEMSVFHLSSMMPMDYWLYRKFIAANDPDILLLYLSEFDLAKKPRLDASKLSPAQGWSLLPILPVLWEISRKTDSAIAFREMAAGEFFPEYKYSFIFRGFLDKWTGKNRALHARPLMEALSPDAAQAREEMESMHQQMGEEWIAPNAYFLEKFLSDSQNRRMKVVIVEGQYNPLAYNEKTERLHRLAHERLKDLAKKYHAVFVPRSDVLPLVENDYSDVTHVKPEPAYAFVKHLLKGLEEGRFPAVSGGA